MIRFIRRVYWEMFLIEDWYFIAMDDCMVRCAYWNGVVWETREAVLQDHQVRRTLAMLPKGNPNFRKAEFDPARSKKYAPVWYDVFFRKWMLVEQVKVIK